MVVDYNIQEGFNTLVYKGIEMNRVSFDIPMKLLAENAKIPTCGSCDAAGWDLYAFIPNEDRVVIHPDETVMISTGIAVAIPQGYWGGIYARSGLASKKSLAPANKVGVIDSDYRGPIIVALHNHGEVDQIVENGERIAQFILHEKIPFGFKVVSELNETERGVGGFGSTGEK